MNDLIQSLRRHAEEDSEVGRLCGAAADEIESLGSESIFDSLFRFIEIADDASPNDIEDTIVLLCKAEGVGELPSTERFLAAAADFLQEVASLKRQIER